MEEPRRPRERELVLAPNEFAYVLDTTKGHINCYVGPNKTSLAQTDELVIFDELVKRFRPVGTESAVLLFATAPANWYVVLKNPAKDGSKPKTASSNAMVELDVGKKVNLPGPVSFPLWPGQMVRVLEGHRLKSNQYLTIRIYDEERAQARWREALGLAADVPEEEAPRFVAGERRIIRGTDVSFYMPPSGVEVVLAEGRWVHDAVTLQRLEYCVLVGDDGRRSYVRGEAVVFPLPDQRFLEKDGSKKLRAIELSDTSGLYVKVIAPYVDEDGTEHSEGEELFLTGSQRIYFPREEHALIRYGDHELHHAIAIPRGEGRYVLDRETGEVSLVRGPLMFLPDPRRQVITRRVLSDRDCTLLYPANAEVLAYNRALRSKARSEPLPVPELAAAPDALVLTPQPKKARAKGGESEAADAVLSRPDRFVAPRTITLDTKLEGAVTVDVWSGYAVQVVDKSGGRRVVQGPSSILLSYDETLEALELSSGTPKSAERRVRTAFLKLAGNKVSDRVRVVTSDLVAVCVGVRYRVSFEGNDASRWFSVDDYVQLLCDHASSLVQARARKLSIRELRATVTDVVRDAVLGARPKEGGRTGLVFEENGMRVYDVEVLELDVVDESVDAMLADAQAGAIRREIQVAERETAVVTERRLEDLGRQLEQEKHETRLLTLQLLALREGREHEIALEREGRQTELVLEVRDRERQDAERKADVDKLRLEAARALHEADVKKRSELQALSERALAARVEASVRQAQAFSPHLVDVLRRLGDERLLVSLGENFAELSAVEGKGLLETARKFLDFVPSGFMPTLKNGSAVALPERDDE